MSPMRLLNTTDVAHSCYCVAPPAPFDNAHLLMLLPSFQLLSTFDFRVKPTVFDSIGVTVLLCEIVDTCSVVYLVKTMWLP